MDASEFVMYSLFMVRIVGGGPAGAAAAIAAIRAGAQVEIYEESPVPRHKVCGEFLTPETLPVLERLGVLKECADVRPALISRVVVHVGSCERQARLSDSAWGLSRYQLDRILLDHAASLGARVIAGRGAPESADVIASGSALARERRLSHPLCGFKAHFRGHGGDTAELFLSQEGCVGLNPVEDGLIAVCGLVATYCLREKDFHPDAFLASRPPLAARIRSLSRATDWLLIGAAPNDIEYDLYQPPGGPYSAGDALGPPEPFTGSGILNALMTGHMAGIAATRRMPVTEYCRQVEKALGWTRLVGSAVRTALDTGWGRIMAPVAPVRWVFRHTRPSLTME